MLSVFEENPVLLNNEITNQEEKIGLRISENNSCCLKCYQEEKYLVDFIHESSKFTENNMRFESSVLE